MNKQRYLAELQRLLVFMTEEDRAEAVRRYADMFDQAGPDGADALVAQIGSPTKAAITLSRGYAPGRPDGPEPERASEPAEPQPEADFWNDLPDFELPQLGAEDDADEEEEEDAGLFAGADDEPRPHDRRRSAPAPRTESEEPWREVRRNTQRERTMPLALGIPLFVLIAAAIGLPVTALVIAVMLLLLVPGAACGVGAYLAAVGALWCVSFMADAILMFGLAFLILAVGIVVLWAGVWADSKLLNLWSRGVEWLCGELLGKRVTRDE